MNKTIPLPGFAPEKVTTVAHLLLAEAISVDNLLLKLGQSQEEESSAAPYLQEWLDSCVSLEIIELNVCEFFGNRAIEVVLSTDLEKYNSQYVTVPLRKILDRYQHLEEGGWYVSGLDPLNNWEPMEWGRFKPYKPRSSADGKPIKYESLKGQRTRATFFRMLDPNYWAKIQADPSQKIYLCGGEKKAASLMSLGFCAIGLPGIWNGCPKDENAIPRLIPELEVFAVPGREFVVIDDEDEKIRTRWAVAQAKHRLAGLLEERGCKVATVCWNLDLGKGIDDVCWAHGADKVREILANEIEVKSPQVQEFPLIRWNPDSLNHMRRVQAERPDFEQEEQKRRDASFWWKIAQLTPHWKKYQRDFKLTVQESDRYNIHRFDGFAPVFQPWQDTIYIRGGLGSGKTGALILSLLEEQWRDLCVVVVTPTNLLGENLIARARAKGIQAMAYQSDVLAARSRLHRNTPGLIVMCPDSFKKYSTGETSWKEKALFIDEFSSIRADILDKPASLPHLTKGIREAAFLILADAFLSDADVSAIENTFGRNQGTSRFYIQNHKKDLTPVKVIQTVNKAGQISGTHDGVWFNLLEYAIEKRSQALDRGEKPEPIYVCSDNLTVLRVLEIWLERNHTDLKIKRVSSLDVETNSGFMSAPDVAMAAEAIDVLLGSPSMQSGCDIQAQFSTTIGIFTGGAGSSPTKAIQHIKRVRHAGEILLSIPTFNYRDQETASLDSCKRRRLTKQAKNLFKSEGIEMAGDLQAFGVWQEQIAKLNAQFNHELTCAIASETFENIEYVYFEGGQTALYQKIRDEIKIDDALKTLTASHIKGKELIDAKKAPSRNQHIWDIRKAQLYKQFPDLVDALAEDLKIAIAAKKKGESTEETEALYQDVLEQGKILLSHKLEKLENYTIASSVDVKKHLERLTEALSSAYPTLNSRRFKRFRAIKLCQELDFGQLAKLGRSDFERRDEVQVEGDLSLVQHQNIYCAESPIVQELYIKFLASEASKYYPEITTVQEFFRAASAAMRACGYQSFAKEVRVESEETRPNGNFRGKERTTHSVKRYFVGFYRIEQSGSKVFRKYFTKFMDAVGALINRDLENHRAWNEKRKRREESESPPVERV